MIREVNAAPFTRRLHYTVEEVSLDEFMAELSKQQEESRSENIDFLKSKLENIRS